MPGTIKVTLWSISSVHIWQADLHVEMFDTEVVKPTLVLKAAEIAAHMQLQRTQTVTVDVQHHVGLPDNSINNCVGAGRHFRPDADGFIRLPFDRRSFVFVVAGLPTEVGQAELSLFAHAEPPLDCQDPPFWKENGFEAGGPHCRRDLHCTLLAAVLNGRK